LKTVTPSTRPGQVVVTVGREGDRAHRFAVTAHFSHRPFQEPVDPGGKEQPEIRNFGEALQDAQRGRSVIELPAQHQVERIGAIKRRAGRFDEQLAQCPWGAAGLDAELLGERLDNCIEDWQAFAIPCIDERQRASDDGDDLPKLDQVEELVPGLLWEDLRFVCHGASQATLLVSD
jgi:hypothetical protein